MSELSARERKKYWEELFANPMWQEYVQDVMSQINARISNILYGDMTDENKYSRERDRGELNGLQLALRMAETAAEQAAEEAANQAKEQDDESSPTV